MNKDRKIDLAEAVHGAATAPRPAPRARRGKGNARPPSRQGTRGVLVHVSPELWRAMRQLALDEDTSVQALGLEALEGLLRRRGRL